MLASTQCMQSKELHLSVNGAERQRNGVKKDYTLQTKIAIHSRICRLLEQRWGLKQASNTITTILVSNILTRMGRLNINAKFYK